MFHSRENCLYLIVPCYEEEQVLELTNKRLIAKCEQMIEEGIVNEHSKILYVDDGSKDGTWEIIKSLGRAYPNRVSGIRLARNEGHQNALMAGMRTAYEYADIVISIDADLQQDIEVLDEFVEKYLSGNDIVFGIRKSRSSDGILKKGTALLFYKLMNWLGTNTIPNHADYRLMSKNALNALFQYKETQLFLRGIIAGMGFQTDKVYFDVKEREAGKSKYTLRKMFVLAINGITSLSIRPLHIVFWTGLISILISLFMIIRNVYIWSLGIAVQGWASILCSLWFLGGAILVALGIIGEYVGKTYMESKERPLYYIKEGCNLDEQN